jgi:hypothetical protein
MVPGRARGGAVWRALHTGADRRGPFQNHQRRLTTSGNKKQTSRRQHEHSHVEARYSVDPHRTPFVHDQRILRRYNDSWVFGRANSCLRVDGCRSCHVSENVGGRSTPAVSLALSSFSQYAASSAPARPEESIRPGLIDAEAYCVYDAKGNAPESSVPPKSSVISCKPSQIIELVMHFVDSHSRWRFPIHSIMLRPY